MNINPDKAMATISLNGLALFCVNKRRMCEYGLMKAKNHTSTLDVQTRPLNGSGPSQMLLSLVNLTEDVVIGVLDAGAAPPASINDFNQAAGFGVELYKNDNVPFNRKTDEGDEHDFRWTLDLEGQEFGKRKLKLRADDSLEDPVSIFPKIYITHGLLYTISKSAEHFSIIQPNSDNIDAPVIGKIAFETGLEIPRSSYKLVIGAVSDGGKITNLIPELPDDPNVKYEIKIDNSCPISQTPNNGTDLQLFYRLLRYPEDPKQPLFDLQRVVPNGGNGTSEDQVAGNENLSLDSFPYYCRGGFLGDTDGLEI